MWKAEVGDPAVDKHDGNFSPPELAEKIRPELCFGDNDKRRLDPRQHPFHDSRQVERKKQSRNTGLAPPHFGLPGTGSRRDQEAKLGVFASHCLEDGYQSPNLTDRSPVE